MKTDPNSTANPDAQPGCLQRSVGLRPLRAIDLFCGAGGASMGIAQAGFDVSGVDISPQPRYPFKFTQADALTFDLSSYDFAWASPPCQRYTRAQNAAKNADAHPDLIDTVREKLEAWGGPWIMENVVGAPLRNPATVCGLALGLKVKRHRLFESNLFLLCPPCPSHDQDYYVIFGHEVRNRRHGQAAVRKNKIKEGRAAMGIDWMTRGELSEAIPPAYAEFLMRQVVRIIQKQPNIGVGVENLEKYTCLVSQVPSLSRHVKKV